MSETPTAGAWHSKLRFGTKLALSFGALVALVAVTATVSIRGVVQVTESYEQALHVGAELGAAVAGARAELLGARRREKEFLLRWPHDGLVWARDTYLRRPPAMSRADPYPEDALQTHAEHMTRLRAHLKTLAVLLRRAEGLWTDDTQQAKELRTEMARLNVAAGDATKQGAAYNRGLDRLVLALNARGNLRAAGDRRVATDKAINPVPGAIAELRAAWGALEASANGAGLTEKHSAHLHKLRGAHEQLLQNTVGRLPYRRLSEGEFDIVDADDLDATGEQEHPRRCPVDRKATGRTEVRAALYASAKAPLTTLSLPGAATVLTAALKGYSRALKSFGTRDDAVFSASFAFLCDAAALERSLDVFEDAGPKAIAALSRKAEIEVTGASAVAYLFALACLLLGIVLAALLSRNIRVPLKDLAQTARQVGDGDLSAQAWVYSEDEIGELATAFNKMTGQLTAQRKRIADQMRQLEAEKERSEQLLLNILPRPIADRLKLKEHPIADQFAEATVLFADVVGYTKLSARLPPKQLVEHLSTIFSAFDEIAGRHGVEKIKTIGDAYMAASGLPHYHPDHLRRMAETALDMQAAVKLINEDLPENIELRIGINSGPVIAGVIGDQKFIYDLWGDAVNVASRMESHGVAGSVHVPDHVYEQLKDHYDFQPRGEIEVKGKGLMRTWLLVARKAPPSPPV